MEVRVAGADERGRPFTEEGETSVVSAHGASILLNRLLVEGQEVIIQCPATRREARAIVVGQFADHKGRHVFGVSLLHPHDAPWNIGFPTASALDTAFVRVLLECSRCHRRELAALNEFEAQAYASTGQVARSCEQCWNWTTWKLASHSASATEAAVDHPSRATGKARNERRSPRLPMKMTACIRHKGFGEELVQVENLSRGGLLFLSTNRYKKGSWIEVAAPYTPGAANVFVLARIVRSQELEEGDVRKYGAEYMRKYHREDK